MKPTETQDKASDVIALSRQASTLTSQLEELMDGIALSEKDVDNFKSTVVLLQQQKQRLNEVLGILNQLPSGIKDEFNKPNPNSNGNRW